jgi:acyl transferase domain-containing protein/aryl carrier-like protein
MHSPIAIVGMACRFPGGDDIDAFWQLLRDGGDAIREVPSARHWDRARYFDPDPEVPGRTYVWQGGFLDHVEAFDAAFFGISPREAIRMDPQQRLLLECVWRALEDGGIAPSRLERTATGLYLGISTNDYLQIGCRLGDSSDIDPYSGTGTAASIAAGRISYCLGLQGPNFPVDTACSSALVALHQACQSLRAGESDTAITAAVNLMLSPDTTVYFAKVRALAADGRCRTFDAAASGYVRSEGVAAVVLRRLEDAQRDRQRILAVIHGSAVNHDGRTTGLTVPNGQSQERLIRRALVNAGCEPRHVGYLEAHGTGTPLGDPIEMRALEEVFSADRGHTEPLVVGSVKTNIGHTEAAAGLAGLVKVVLALRAGQIPRHLHFDDPSPFIPWARIPIRVPTVLEPWRPIDGRRIAGLSSFGFSGTNAHVILGEPPPSPPTPRRSSPADQLLVVSAKTPAAFSEAAATLAARIEVEGDDTLADACYTAAHGRSHFPCRASARVTSRAEAVELLHRLRDTAAGRSAAAKSPRQAWLFPGDGPLQVDNGAVLYRDVAVFREAIDEMAAAVSDMLETPLTTLLFDPPPRRITAEVHASLFAVEHALARMWAAWGLTPAIVVGHSIGEFVAAAVAGVMSPAAAVRFLVTRAELLDRLTPAGGLVVLAADVDRANALVAAVRGTLAIAAENSATNTVVAGSVADLDRLEAAAASERIACQRLQAAHAYHTAAMDPVVEASRAAASALDLQAPRIGMVSSVTGRLETEAFTRPDYWAAQVREPVRFRDTLDLLQARDYRVFLEVGPAAVLTPLGRHARAQDGGTWVASLNAGKPTWTQILDTLRQLFEAGVDPDWQAVWRDQDVRIVSLPGHPFARTRFVPDLPGWGEGVVTDAAARPLPPGPAVPISEVPAAEPVSGPAARQRSVLHRLHWLEQEGRSDSPSVEVTGTWLVVERDPDSPLAHAICDLVERSGGKAVCVAASASAGGTTETCRIAEPTADEFGRVFARLDERGLPPLSGIVFACDGSAPPDAAVSDDLLAEARWGVGAAVEMVKAMSRRRDTSDPWLGFVTRGSQAVRSGESCPGWMHAGLWGLGRVMAVEYPLLRSQRIDLDPTSSMGVADEAAAIIGLATTGDEDQVALRDGRRYVLRLEEVSGVPDGEPSRLRGDATYLVTGGLGSLGTSVAHWLAERGARHICVAGRRPDAETLARLTEAVTSVGATVEAVACDVADAAAVERLVAELANRPGRPLAGVVHAAGVLDDGPIAELDWQRCAGVLRPKILGAWNLHRATAALPLELFICFSSVAAVLGSPKQGSYAAANAAMDALMCERRHLGLHGLGIAWGPWAEQGMAARMGEQQLRGWSRMGIEPLTTVEAIAWLDSLAGSSAAQAGVFPMDWSLVLSHFPVGIEPPVLRDIAARHRTTLPPSEAWTALCGTLRRLPSTEHHDLVSRYVEKMVADVLGHTDAGGIDIEAGFVDLGLDSLMAVDLRARFQADVGRRHALAVTFVLDCPTIEAVTRYLMQHVVPIVVAEQPSEPALPAAVHRQQPPRADATSTAAHAEIAIVGLGCRFPGQAVDADSFWRLLAGGVDAVGQVPANRWTIDRWYDSDPDAPGKMNCRHGGFLDDVETFDAAFFGISPREAVRLDPQHRLVLEVAVEALERAKQPLDRLVGSASAVFLGLSGDDYLAVLRSTRDPQMLDGMLATGNALSIAAGRVSHALGWHGPCMTIDTACSSSLVAVHLAVQCLREGRASLALAGGVGLLLSPEVSISLTKARALSPDGRCKTFDATANGYVRGEGCGLVALKRLDDALRDGDPIMAVLRGTAINHDGRSGGLTVPNVTAQEALLRDALSDAGLTAGDVDYIEAHGTGTPLGDPIEMQAINAVYGGRERRNRPLLVGSVKTNIGHLEAAAGIAGLIKTVLSLEHGEIPPHLHFRQPNPFIPWAEMAIEVPTRRRGWPDVQRARRAAVSSFGFSGTNAHVVVESAPAATRDEPAADPLGPDTVLCLSAKSAAALESLAATYAEFIGRGEHRWEDICFSAAAGRGLYAHRLVVTADSAAAAVDPLRAVAGRRTHPRAAVRVGESARRPKVAFLFTGEQSQFVGMGRGLYEAGGVFRDEFDRCAALLREQCDLSVLDLVCGRPGDPEAARLLDRADITRAAVFCLEVALFRTWEHWGVRPSAVLGHGVGELAAACCAGVFSLADGLRLVAARGRSTEPMPATYEAILSEIDLREPTIGLVSSLHGRFVTAGEATDPASWVRQVREPADVVAGIRALAEQRYAVYLEVGPDDGLAALGRQSLPDRGELWQSTLTPRRPEGHAVTDVLRDLFLHGVRADWRSVFGNGRRWVDVPGYPFQRQRFWPLPEGVAADTVLEDVGGPHAKHADAGDHSFLGRVFETESLPGVVFDTTYDEVHPSFVAEHQVHGMVVVPGAAYLSMVVAASRHRGHDRVRIDDVAFPEPMFLPSGEGRQVQVVVRPQANGEECRVVSRGEGDVQGRWRMHARGVVHTSGDGEATEHALLDPMEVQERCREQTAAGADLYDALARAGVLLGPSFRWNAAVWRRDGEALTRMEWPRPAPRQPGCGLHPGLLDSCIQAAAICLPFTHHDYSAYVPVGVETFTCHRDPVGPLWCHAVIRDDERASRGTFTSDVRLHDGDGRLLVEFAGLRMQRAPRTAIMAFANRRLREWMYRLAWVEKPRPAFENRQTAGRWLVFTESDGLGQRVASLLQDQGATCSLVTAGRGFATATDGCLRINPRDPADWDRLLGVADESAPWTGIVFLWPLASDPVTLDDLSVRRFDAAQASGSRAVLELLQAVSRRAQRQPPQVTVVTRGTQATGRDDGEIDVTHAPLWGLARVAAMEMPQLGLVRIDLAADDAAARRTPAAQDAEARQIVAELLDPDGEDQIAFRADARLAARLARGTAGGPRSTHLIGPGGSEPYRLAKPFTKSIEDLEFQPVGRLPPAAGEIEIAIRATGLNFRDVLNTLGLYPGEGGPLGFECAGLVTAVGGDVTHVRPGDRVVGLSPGSLGPFVLTDARLATVIPEDLTFADAATLPIVFLTVQIALGEQARLTAGDTLLVHSAAGGVGLAAIQLAARVGARVIATAGSEEKRAHLRSLGIEHVFDSRSHDFPELVRGVTGGRGADVVLNALPGEHVGLNLAALATGGRFAEIGKSDTWAVEGWSEKRPDVRYATFALDDLSVNHPSMVGGHLRQLVADVAAGLVRPLPHTDFPMDRVKDAFRYMAHSKHIGKVVVTQQDFATSRAAEQRIHGEASYLVTGGLGALGMLVARWLADHGARHLVLVGRRPPDEATARQVEELRGLGVEVVVASVDLTVPAQLRQLVRRLRKTLPPLAGVVHAAGVLDDGMLMQQDWSRFERVMQSKVRGAIVLHELSREVSFDWMIMFSSIASVWGSPGQGNYAAANAFLDSLAHARRQTGLPAMSINWGPWADVGMAARMDAGNRHWWQVMGIGTIPPAQGMSIMEMVVQDNPPQVAVLPVEWPKVVARLQLARPPALIADLVLDQRPAVEASREWLAFVETLRGAPPAERVEMLVRHIQNEAARVLGLDAPEKLDPHVPLQDLGFDSLMAVELANQMAATTGMSLSVTLLVDHPTLHAVAGYIVRTVLELDDGSAEGTAAVTPPSPTPAGPSAAPDVPAATPQPPSRQSRRRRSRRRHPAADGS